MRRYSGKVCDVKEGDVYEALRWKSTATKI